jgi:hypothetical protein
MHVPFTTAYIPKTTTKLLLLILVAVGVSFHTAYAADVLVSPSTGTYSSGQSFTATIKADPKGSNINAVEAKLSFDNTKLSVVSLSKTGSAFSLWTTEPTFSNSDGTIDFGGGSPTPFSSVSTVLTVTFRALAEGSANVKVASASVLAADGKGTDVYSGSVDATYTIGAASTQPTETTPSSPLPAETTSSSSNAAITFGDAPQEPVIGSKVFLDPDVWYATKDGSFTWDVPFDVDEMALDVATSADAHPTTTYKPPIKELTTSDKNLSEGEQYVTIQFKNQVGWGAILHRKLLIDTMPPNDFAIDVHPGNSKSAFPLLNFNAIDDTSGIDHYEMTIAGGDPIEITPEEAKLGYLLGKLEDGTYTVKVTAFDKAGNTKDSSVPVLITAGWTPPVETASTTSVWDLFKGKNLIITILILAVLFLIGYIYIGKKRLKKREEKLRKETKEIQDQMEKIFSALRDEMYEQINHITKRQRLSKRERETVEGLNQALDVSETLIEKEIGDVKEILK